jgi:hypothetical protein
MSTIHLCSAQEFELIPYASYHWGGKLTFYDGEIKFKSSENYGLALNVVMPSNTVIHVEYMVQPTKLDLRYYGELGPEYKQYPVNMNWFQIGGMQQIEFGKVMPFGGITLGALYFRPRSNEIQDSWKFAVTGQIGLKYYFNDKIGIRIHGGIFMPIQWAGFGLHFGTGGAGAGVNAGSYLLQGDIGGGLIFRLNAGKKSIKPQSM